MHRGACKLPGTPSRIRRPGAARTGLLAWIGVLPRSPHPPALPLQVNGINVEGMKHSEVVSHIKSKENEAKLLVVDPETDDYFKKLGVTPAEEHIKGECETPAAALALGGIGKVTW